MVVGNATRQGSCPVEFSYLPVFVQFDVNMGAAVAMAMLQFHVIHWITEICSKKITEGTDTRKKTLTMAMD